MLSAKKMADALRDCGVEILGYEETKDPKLMDGEVRLENALSVQVGYDYACLCVIRQDEIEYLLETEDLKNEASFAREAADFLTNLQS